MKYTIVNFIFLALNILLLISTLVVFRDRQDKFIGSCSDIKTHIDTKISEVKGACWDDKSQFNKLINALGLQEI